MTAEAKTGVEFIQLKHDESEIAEQAIMPALGEWRISACEIDEIKATHLGDRQL